MDHEKVWALFDRQMRLGARPDEPAARVERVGNVVRHLSPPGGWHGVLWSDLDEDTADAAIAEQVRVFRELGGEAEWKTYSHDRPADLPARLVAAGFVAEEPETLLVAETAVLPLDSPLPEGIRLMPVTEEAHIALVEAVHARAFENESSVIGHQIRQQLANDPDTVPAVLALYGDEPVSAARLELNPGTDFAGLWGGGTVHEWRGRGIYRALVAYRVRIAAERGYTYMQVDATEYSRPILERLGFEKLGTTTPYVLPADSAE